LVKNDHELYNILMNFNKKIPVFRDLSENNTPAPYIVYRSVNCKRIYGSGQIIGSFKEFEIVLIQKEKNDIKLKEKFNKYLDENQIIINNNMETATNEEGERYFFLTVFTNILEKDVLGVN